MRKHINTFEQHSLLESLEVVTQRKINIGNFDNEIELEDMWKLERKSAEKSFSDVEKNELKIYFGKISRFTTVYPFKYEVGWFGKEKIVFSGDISKKIKYNENDKDVDGIYFLIKGYMSVSMGTDLGRRSINIKLNKFVDIFKFFDDFYDNVELSF